MKHTHTTPKKWLGLSLLPILFQPLAAQDPTFSLAAAGDNFEFGTAFAAAGDVNGDGMPDIAVSDRSARVDSFFASGAVYVLSGLDGSLLRRHTGNPAPSQNFGSSLASLDADGDGSPDLAVGSPGESVGGSYGSGAVRIHSGADGSVLVTVTGAPQSQLGSSLANAGDQNGDGCDDLYAGAPLGDGYRGQVLVISGKDGSILRTVGTDVSSSSFGRGVVAMDDIDGDGLRDLAVSAPGYRSGGFNPVGRVQLIRSSDSSVAAQVAGSGTYAQLGLSIAPATDVDGDGLAELMIGSFSTGTARLVSGADFSLVRDLSIPTLPPFRPLTVGGALDYDNDGTTDWLLGSSAFGTLNGTLVGGVRIVSGADGSTLFEKTAGAPYTGLGDFLTVLPGLGFAAGEPSLRDAVTGGYGAAHIWVLSQDSDGDGIPDSEDANPNSNNEPNIVIGGIDTGVANSVDEQGVTLADRFDDLGTVEDYRNEALYFVAVLHLAKELGDAGLLDGQSFRQLTGATRSNTVGKKGKR